MFTMLNYRIVAALVAAEVFLSTVLFPTAGPLLGAAAGALAGAAIFAVGRSVLRTVHVPAGVGAERWLLVASAGAFTTLLAFYLVLAGPGGLTRWSSVAAVVLALVVIGVASVRLNRAVDAGAPVVDEAA